MKEEKLKQLRIVFGTLLDDVIEEAIDYFTIPASFDKAIAKSYILQGYADKFLYEVKIRI